jgi:branched-chain amino acid transport system substrate-binding protein
MRRGWFGAVLLAVALAATACGSSGSSKAASTGAGGGSGSGGAGSCSGPGISNGTVTVGVIQQTTGNPNVVLDFQYAVKTVQARFNVQNSQGGVHGLKLTAVAADDGGTTTGNLAAARQLVEQDHVFGIVEMSIEPGGSGAYLKQSGVPVTGWATASDPYALDNNFFGATGSIDANPAQTPNTSLVGFLKTKGVTNLALFGGTDPGSISVSQGTAAAARAIGMKVGYQTNSINFGQSDFTADVARMRSAGVNGVVTELDPTTNLALVKAIQQAGLHPVVLLTTGYDQRLISAVGPLVAGDYFLVQFAPFELNLPAFQKFKSAMAQYAPQVPISEVSAYSWLSADLFIKGLEVAGSCPTRAGFIQNLRHTTYDAGGFVYPIDESKSLGHSALCNWFVQAQGKAFVPVSPQPYCGKRTS